MGIAALKPCGGARSRVQPFAFCPIPIQYTHQPAETGGHLCPITSPSWCWSGASWSGLPQVHHPDGSHQGWAEPAALPSVPRCPLAGFATRACWWLTVNPVPSGTPVAFSAKLLCSMCWCPGSFLPRWGVIPPSFNSAGFLLTHFSSPSRSLWMVPQPSGLATTPYSFVSSASLLRCSLYHRPGH